MNILGKVIAGFLKLLAELIYAGLSAANISIYNLVYSSDGPISKLTLFTPGGTQDLLAQFYNIFTYIALAMFIPIAYWAGTSISKGGDSPQHKSMLKDRMMKLVLTMVYLYTMPEILTLLVKISNGLTSVFAGIGQSVLGGNNSDVVGAYLATTADMDIISAFTALMLVGLNLWMIFHYIIRDLTITFLFVFFPIIAIWYPFSEGMIKQWWKTLLGNLFVQPIHAVVLTVVLSMGAANIGSASTTLAQDTFTLVSFAAIIPISSVIKSMLGLESGVGAGSSRAGFGGLLMATRLASGAIRGAGRAKDGIADAIQEKAGNKIATEEIEKNLQVSATGRAALGGLDKPLPSSSSKALENINTTTATGKQEALEKIKRSNKAANKQILKNVGSIAGGAFLGTAGAMIGAGMGDAKASTALGFAGVGIGSMAGKNLTGASHTVASAVLGVNEFDNKIKELQVQEAANELFKNEETGELDMVKAKEYINTNPEAYKEIAQNKYVGLDHKMLKGSSFQAQERNALLSKKRWEHMGSGNVSNYFAKKSYASLTPARKSQEELRAINNAVLYQDREKSIIYTPNNEGGVGEILSVGSGNTSLSEPRYNSVSFTSDSNNIVPEDVMLSYTNIAEANALSYMSTAFSEMDSSQADYKSLYNERKNHNMRELIYNYQQNIGRLKENMNIQNISIQTNPIKLEQEKTVYKNIQMRRQKLEEAQTKIKNNTRLTNGLI